MANCIDLVMNDPLAVGMNVAEPSNHYGNKALFNFSKGLFLFDFLMHCLAARLEVWGKQVLVKVEMAHL